MGVHLMNNENKQRYFRIRRLKPQYRKKFRLMVLAIVVVSVLIWLFHLYQNTKNTVNKAYRADQATALIKQNFIIRN